MMRALIIGDTGGIGAAVAAHLAGQGADVTGLSRARDGLNLTDEGSIARVLGALDGAFDLIFVATGALGQPEKTLKVLDPAQMAAQFALNAMGPALVLKHALHL
ncbi:NAD-dependent epimerase/dehydratase family protein, partial [Candidatus Falkowbacteria bacterium]|nr:NAD-dependent epimerase/dehydratase family protein [Candidatus Falkowbacteria bacterium]